jgi:DNA-binding MarR family transcriptional regulator
MSRPAGRLSAAGDDTASEGVVSEIATALSAVSRVINQLRAHDVICKQAGIDVDRAGAALLHKLHTEGENVRLTELADRLGVDSPAVTRKVQQLERQGLVCRSADPEDARASRLKLTVDGRRAAQRLLQARRDYVEGLLQGWSEHDRRQLARVLQRLAASLTRHEESSAVR